MKISYRSAAAVIALAFGAIVAYGVCGIPIQVSDSLGNMLQIQQPSLQTVLTNQFTNQAYLRPMLWTQIKVAYDMASGHEQLTFKAIHVAQVFLLVVFFVRLMQVRTRADCAAAIIALLVLFGIHTFDGMVREAFPINSFLTIAICTLAAANVMLGPPWLWKDLVAVALFCFAILTIESGVLVLAALVAGRIVGLEGVSWRGVALTAVAFVAYLIVRFLLLDVGSPGLAERPSGFGFRILEPSELVARFGSNPAPFYVYNVVCSLLSVFMAEPRGGVWYVVRTLSDGGNLPPWLVINIVSSVAATSIVVYGLSHSVRRWRAGEAQYRERIMLTSAAVLLANGLVSFAYLKDVVMSTGGVFFALATHAGTTVILAQPANRAKRWLAAGAVAIAVACWSMRAVALPYRLEMQASRVQAEWSEVSAYPWLDDWRERNGIETDWIEAHALVLRLRGYALGSEPHNVNWTGWRRFLDLN